MNPNDNKNRQNGGKNNSGGSGTVPESPGSGDDNIIIIG